MFAAFNDGCVVIELGLERRVLLQEPTEAADGRAVAVDDDHVECANRRGTEQAHQCQCEEAPGAFPSPRNSVPSEYPR